MDGEIVHPLLALFDQGVAIDFPVQVLGHAVHLFQGLIDGHGADGDGAVADDPLADVVDVAPGGEVHHVVGAPADGEGHLLHLFRHRGGDGGVADVGVDLDQEVPPDRHRLQLAVVDVGGDDGAAAGDLGHDELGGDELGDFGAEVFAVADGVEDGFAAEVLADSHELHFRGDDAAPGVVELGDAGRSLGAHHRALSGKFGDEVVGGDVAVVLRLDLAGRHLLHVAARHHPGVAGAGQAFFDVDGGVRVGIGAGGGRRW